MIQSKHEFFHQGVDTQKRADIVVDLKRIDNKKIAKWTPEHKQNLPEFIATCERVFASFIAELKSIE